MKKNIWVLLVTILCLTGCGKQETAASGETTVPERKVTGYEFAVPDGFEPYEVENWDSCYVAGDGSIIYMTIEDDKPDFEDISSEMFIASYEETLSESHGTEIDVTENFFTREPVCDFPAYQFSLSYEEEGSTVTIVIVSIDADKTYTVMYIDETGEWKSAFEESAKGIVLTTE